MYRSKLGRLAIPALFFLAACATPYSPTPYWTIRETAFKSLTPGTTTKAEARKLIGAPLTETHFGRLNEDVWEYRYLEGTTIVMLAHVHFDHNGTYTYSFHMLIGNAHSVKARQCAAMALTVRPL